MKKTLKLIFSVLSICSLVSCKKKQENNDAPKQEEPRYNVVDDKFIMENGVSEYVVLLSKTPQAKETMAADEFTYFMKLATGYNFQVVDDQGIRNNQKYISLGVTEKFKSNFPDYNYSEIDKTQSAYFLSTKDENIYLVSSDDFDGDGVLYGVYDLLHDLVGYKYYHDTEVFVENKTKINLLDYSQQFIRPSYDIRSISTLYTYTNDIHSKRLKLINNSRGYEWCRAAYGHGQIGKYLGPWMLDENGVKYGVSHPEWFYDPNMVAPERDGLMIENCLNWCAGDELETVVANRMIEFISGEPNCTFVMCAQEDNHVKIDALPGVSEALNGWAKGSQSALQINFMNHVITKVEKWVSENQPGRELQYVIFAYHTTVEPPIDNQGNPIVQLHDKLRIYFAPISANFAFPLSSPINKDTLQMIEGWDKVAHGKIILYLYDLNWRMYFATFNNIGAAHAMYKEFLKYGISYMMTQGVSDSNAPCFDELRIYCESQLMWNVNLNYDELAFDFINNFYKEAAGPIKDLYNLIRNRYAYYQTMVDPSSGMGSGNLINTSLYPLEFVRQEEILIKKAFDLIKHLEINDYNRYLTIFNRVMKEYLPVIYMKVLLYADYYSQEELAEMRETFYFYTNKFGITKIGEGNPIQGAIG